MMLLNTKRFNVDFYFDAGFGFSATQAYSYTYGVGYGPDWPSSSADATLKTDYSRSIVFWGMPLPGYTSIYDRTEKQETAFQEYVMIDSKPNLQNELETISAPGYSKAVNTYYFMGALIWEVFLQVLLFDAGKAVLSIMCVRCWRSRPQIHPRHHRHHTSCSAWRRCRAEEATARVASPFARRRRRLSWGARCCCCCWSDDDRVSTPRPVPLPQAAPPRVLDRCPTTTPTDGSAGDGVCAYVGATAAASCVRACVRGVALRDIAASCSSTCA